MTNEARSFAPHTPAGRVGVVLGFGLVVVLVLLFLISNTVTRGGSESAPVWLRIAAPASVLVIALPSVVIGLRSRRTDPSALGTIALVIACVIGGWVAITGVASLFFE